MSKKIRYNSGEIKKLRNQIKRSYDNKYYNLFLNTFKFEPEDNISEEEKKFLLKQLWCDGTIAITKNQFVDMLVYTPYRIMDYNLYEYPETVRLVNLHMSPLVNANKNYIINKDCVLMWILNSKQSIRSLVDPFIDRIVSVEMIINTNLIAHKLPLLMTISEQDADKARDIINRLLEDEPVLFTDVKDLTNLQAFVSGTPYIIDKLYAYKNSLEAELQTLLGIDNNMSNDTRLEYLTVDQVNSSNILTNNMLKGMLDNMNAAFKKVDELFNINIEVKSNVEQSSSVHEESEVDNIDVTENGEV